MYYDESMVAILEPRLQHSGRILARLAIVVFVSLQVACGGGADTPDNPAESADSLPKQVSSTSGCLVHTDCAEGLYCLSGACVFDCSSDDDCAGSNLCSDRGLCLETGDQERRAEVPETVSAPVIDWTIDGQQTPNAIRISAGQTEVQVPVELAGNGSFPDEGIKYRIERTDANTAELGDSVFRTFTFDGPSNSVVLDVGGASPDSENPQVVGVVFRTEAGTVRTSLIPQSPATGVYAGFVRVDELGGVDVPIDFAVITEPEDSDLETAERVWLEMDISEFSLFSPAFPRPGGPESIAVEMEFDSDPDVDKWVAQFRTPYNMPAGGVLPQYGDDFLGREIRLQLAQLPDGSLQGEVRDFWSGVVESRRIVDGVEDKSPDTIRFNGSLEARWIGERDDVPLRVITQPALPDRLIPAPALDSCEGSALPDFSISSCDGISNVFDFRNGTIDAKADCAIGLSAELEAESDVADVLAAFIGGEGETSSTDFGSFIEDCRNGAGECATSDQVYCVRELVAFAFHQQPLESDSIDPLAEAFVGLSQGAALGAQMRAFAQDMETRKDWLESTNLPSFVASAVRSVFDSMLSEWETNVLDQHRTGLRLHLDDASLAVLSRELTEGANEAAKAARKDIVLLATQAWSGFTTSLELAASRWHLVATNDLDRAALAESYMNDIREAYIAAGLLRKLNILVGAGGNNAVLGSGLVGALDGVARLRTRYSHLLFARDGEVIVPTSVDPQTTTVSLPRERRLEAVDAVALAANKVEEVLNEVQAERLSQLQYANQSEVRVNEILTQMAELCGMPRGCTEVDTGACRPNVEEGRCGFVLEGDTVVPFDASVIANGGRIGDESISAAGRLILSIYDAGIGVSQAEEELSAHLSQADLALEELNALAADIELWNQLRTEGYVVTQEAIQRGRELRAASINSLEDSIAAQARIRRESSRDRESIRRDELERQRTSQELTEDQFDEQSNVLSETIDRTQTNIEGWNEIRQEGCETDFQGMKDEFRLRQDARHLQSDVALATDLANAALTAMPRAAGTAADPTSVMRGMVAGQLAGANRAARQDAGSLQDESERLSRQRAYDGCIRSADLQLAQSEDRLNDLRTQGEREAIQNEMQRIQQELNYNLADLRQDMDRSREQEAYALAEEQGRQQLTQQELQNLMADVGDAERLQREELASQEAYGRDLSRMREKQTAYYQLMLRSSSLDLQVERSHFRIVQLTAEYLGIVQRAQLLEDQLKIALEQRDQIFALISSPAVIFSSAAKLESAEQALDRAREIVWKYLLALEYYAVRPFTAERMMLVMARSPGQLEGLVNHLQDLEDRCGGPVNAFVSEHSVRSRFMGIDGAQTDPVTGATLSPAERFRQALDQHNVRADRRIRYSADGTVGSILNSSDGILSIDFPVELANFSNLSQSCNAKIASLGISLVGDFDSTVTPSVSILYDGTSELRSCQPNIDDLVSLIQGGADDESYDDIDAANTSYGSVSRFRSAGRSVTPPALINESPQIAENITLAGYPLASTYTLLIDTNQGENGDLDWSKLEDIVVRIGYTYQDFFTGNDCQ